MSEAGQVVESRSAYVCHCRRVPYERVHGAVDRGARSLADVQRQTTACTRCFGCRFELEELLATRLGDDYERAPQVSLPDEFDEQPSRLGRLVRRVRGAAAAQPRRMYIPVFHRFRGYDVRTRVVLFNWGDEHGGEQEPVTVRADLFDLAGERRYVWNAAPGPRCSAVLEFDELVDDGGLPDGVGVLKLVLDADQMGSLRPYFHLSTANGITSTHEKPASRDPRRRHRDRPYHWIMPIGPTRAPEEGYLFFTNTQLEPVEGTELVWHSVDGEEQRLPLGRIELDQSVCIPLHEHFPAIGEGRAAGSVRLDPSPQIAGWMLRHDPRASLWRVQHL